MKKSPFKRWDQTMKTVFREFVSKQLFYERFESIIRQRHIFGRWSPLQKCIGYHFVEVFDCYSYDKVETWIRQHIRLCCDYTYFTFSRSGAWRAMCFRRKSESWIKFIAEVLLPIWNLYNTASVYHAKAVCEWNHACTVVMLHKLL